MQRLEKEHLKNIVLNGRDDDPRRDVDRLRHFLALILLRHYLGGAWSDECIAPQLSRISGDNRAGRLFLRTDGTSVRDRFKYQERVTRLAELLYNLQDVQGIEGRRASIREGSVESTYAELEFAGHFFSRAIEVRFLDRSGVKGSDYDFNACAGEFSICCEVKCKLESTDLGGNTITNALNHARKQTPSDKPAIIGVKIPEAWIKVDNLKQVFESALADFFRNSGRVVAVVVRWEELETLPTGQAVTFYRFRTYRNDNSRSLNEDVLKLVHLLTQSPGTNWVSLHASVLATLRL